MPPKKKPTTRPWQDIAAETQQYRDSTISELSPPVPYPPSKLPKNVLAIPKTLLSSEELEITSLPPEKLLEKLTTGHVAATAVTLAYLRRAGLAQRLTNCLTELLPSRALARAKELDDYFASHGRPIGPLHGLPISVKVVETITGN